MALKDDVLAALANVTTPDGQPLTAAADRKSVV